MKKKIFYIFAILALMLPCFALAGCGEEKRVEVLAQNQLYCKIIKKGTFSHNGTNYLYNELMLDSELLNTEVSYDIVLDDSYDADTLKVFANGAEITWTKAGDYNNDTVVNNFGEQVVGSFSYVLKANTQFTVECKEKTLNFKFAIKDNATLTNEQKTILNDFYFSSEKSLLEYIENDWSIGITFSEIRERDLLLACNKKIGYYNTFEVFENASLMSNWTEEKNGYRITNLMYDSSTNIQSIKNQNTLIINPEGLQISAIEFNHNEGSILEITSTDVDLNSAIRTDANAKILIRLVEKEGIDVENAVLYINGSLVPKTGTHWIVFTSKLPIEYLEYNAGYDNYSYEVIRCISQYNIEIKNVVVTDETKLTKIIGVADDAKIRGASYFYSPVEGVYYAEHDETMPGNVGIEFYMGGNENRARYVVIAKNDDTENATIVDILQYITGENNYFTVDGYDIVLTIPISEKNLDNLYSVTVYAEKIPGTTYTVTYTNNINN